MAHVRPYQPSDEEAVIHVFRETAHVGLRTNPDPSVLRTGEFLWCRPYIHFYPDWCFVVDDGNGKAVGYVLCAPDTVSFMQKLRAEFFTVLLENGIKKPTASEDPKEMAVRLRNEVFNPESQVPEGCPDILKDHPAHLHIDILSSHQGQGLGKVLIATLFQKLLLQNVPGIFLGMSFDNDAAGRFYARLGFEGYSALNEEGQIGRQGQAIYLVRTFQRDQPT